MKTFPGKYIFLELTGVKLKTNEVPVPPFLKVSSKIIYQAIHNSWGSKTVSQFFISLIREGNIQKNISIILLQKSRKALFLTNL